MLVEAHDSFIKQTYRNRCLIAATSGTQALTVPVERNTADSGATAKCLMKDVRISDHGNWRRLHWNAIMSAYGESPFFEYYADDLRPFFEKRWTFLYDFNMETCATVCSLIGLEPRVEPTAEYVAADDPRLAGLPSATLLPGVRAQARLHAQPEHTRPALQHG